MQSAQKVATATLTFVRKLYHPTALSLLLPFSSQLDVESLIECHSGRKSNLSSSERGWIKGPLLRTMMRRLLLNMQIQSGWSKTIDRNFFYNLSHNSVKSPFFTFFLFVTNLLRLQTKKFWYQQVAIYFKAVRGKKATFLFPLPTRPEVKRQPFFSERLSSFSVEFSSSRAKQNV